MYYAGLQLNLKKCRLGAKQLGTLGHMLSKDGILPQASKIRTVTEFPKVSERTPMLYRSLTSAILFRILLLSLIR